MDMSEEFEEDANEAESDHEQGEGSESEEEINIRQSKPKTDSGTIVD
jgi:hypothetical protein